MAIHSRKWRSGDNFSGSTRFNLLLIGVFILLALSLISFSNWQEKEFLAFGIFLLLAVGLIVSVAISRNKANLPDVSDDSVIFFTRHDRSGYTISVSLAGIRNDFCDLDQVLGGGLFERLHITSRPAYLKVLSDAVHARGEHLVELSLRLERVTTKYPNSDEYVTFEAQFKRQRHWLGRKTESAIYGAFKEKRSKNIELNAREDANRLILGKLEHELRTPLNAIIGFSELLADPKMVAPDDPRRSEYMRIVATAGRHMLEIIDDLNGRVDGDPQEMRPSEKTRIFDLVDEAVGMLSFSASAARADISYSIEPDLAVPKEIRHFMRQILLNLISNSVKYAPAGKINISAMEEEGVITLSISDNGIGVEPQDLHRLAEPYFRAGRDQGNLPDGQGLGLSVVKGLVDRLGGALRFDSEPGKGTQVVLRLNSDGSPLSGPRRAVDGQLANFKVDELMERKRA